MVAAKESNLRAEPRVRGVLRRLVGEDQMGVARTIEALGKQQ